MLFIVKFTEPMSLSLFLLSNQNCIPILMYGLEGLDLNKTLLHKLDNPLFLA